jgi:ferredoxin-NADP reductase
VPDAAPRPAKLAWQPATVTAIVARTPRIKSFFFALPEPASFVPGQHMDVRLVAPDGYEAQRSYSIASAPEQRATIELAIERLQDGEVSPFFHDEVRIGDEIELRGPIGGHFMWSVEDGGPLLLVGGGSGVVPLASMIRHHAARASAVPITLVYSARTAGDLLYLDELRSYAAAQAGFSMLATVTREAPRDAGLRSGRIDRALLARAIAAAPPALTFVCGTNAFVEAATGLALDLGLSADAIRTERYGG